MARQYLLDQRRARARHADDEYRYSGIVWLKLRGGKGGESGHQRRREAIECLPLKLLVLGFVEAMPLMVEPICLVVGGEGRLKVASAFPGLADGETDLDAVGDRQRFSPGIDAVEMCVARLIGAVGQVLERRGKRDGVGRGQIESVGQRLLRFLGLASP